MYSGTYRAKDAVFNADDGFAREAVARGDAVFTSEPTPAPPLREDVAIPAANIVGSSAVGRAVLLSPDIETALAALGLEIGANDSGGAGFRSLKLPNTEE